MIFINETKKISMRCTYIRNMKINRNSSMLAKSDLIMRWKQILHNLIARWHYENYHHDETVIMILILMKYIILKKIIKNFHWNWKIIQSNENELIHTWKVNNEIKIHHAHNSNEINVHYSYEVNIHHSN